MRLTAASLAVVALLLHVSALADTARVRIDSGELIGVIEDDVAIFRGIPYAAPPVGDRRWRVPAPVEPWSGARDATRFGHACPQKDDDYREWVQRHLEDVGRDEDCLTLNVWFATEGSGKPLPVMVYIHGGNMQYGAGSLPLYDGSHWARDGLVFVTINYRLGYLGRFAHPALTRLQPNEPHANYGVFDQIAALEWVQRNIAAFGGDPNNVTIFGHSAGGVSVNVLMTTPQSKGLFHRAIAQGSGVLLDMNQHAFERGRPGPAAKSREDMGVDFAKHFEIAADNDADLLAKLRAIDPVAMVDYQNKRQVPFNPVVDGRVVVEHVARVFERGQQHDVPYVGGANDWESNQIERIPLIGKWFLAGALLDGLSEVDLAPFDDQWTRIGRSQRWFAEGLFLTSTRYFGKQMTNVDSPAFLYHLTYVQTNLRGDVPGAAHGIEVPFLFGHLRDNPIYQRPREFADRELTAEDHAFGDTLRAYWLNFARHGDPNGPGLPNWPAYTPDNDLVQVLGETIEPQAGLYRESLDHLEQRALARRAEFLNASSPMR